MATTIKSSQLPKHFPVFPNWAEFDIYASMTPTKEVRGDFYDFFMVDDDHFVLVMADVSGEGVPAALFMMVSHVLIKPHLQNGEKPGEALVRSLSPIEGIPFREHEFELHKGDALLVYTDGLAEVTDANDEQCGADRMMEALNAQPEAKPKEFLDNVKDGIDRFVRDAKQFDDITMLYLEYKGV